MIKIFGLVIMTKKEFNTVEIGKNNMLKGFDKFITNHILYGNSFLEKEKNPGVKK